MNRVSRLTLVAIGFSSVLVGMVALYALLAPRSSDNDATRQQARTSTDVALLLITPAVPDSTPTALTDHERANVDAALKAVYYYLGVTDAVRSGEARVLFAEPVFQQQLLDFGLAGTPYPPTCKREMALVIVGGDFNIEYLAPGFLHRPPAAYIGFVYDVESGILSGIITSEDGSIFKAALRDPSLPDRDPREMPTPSGEGGWVSCETVEAPAGPAPATPEPPATPAPGQPYPDNPAFAGQDLTVVRTDAPPLISQAEAMEAVSRLGVPWGNGGEWEGRTVTVVATYGLVTAGQAGEGGKPWVGLRNLPLPDGKTLDHIEGRPMWVVDYGNTFFIGAGCPECTPPPNYNHSVYLVDAETASAWVAWGYVGE
ncbi:MAG TPA: hypothetical protein DEG70_08580 [Chloroflexi bacterium]|nr:hypothetical protein [Chloroflexota bacterium]